MKPTNELRFVKRTITSQFGDDSGDEPFYDEDTEEVLILQQKWEKYHWGPNEQFNPKHDFEWRDVPVEEE